MAELNAHPDTRLWHPFSDMYSTRRREFVIDRGEGVWIYDQEGHRYLDASASLWYANVGHGRSEIADAVRAQMTRLEAYSTFGEFANEPARQVAARLSSLAPVDDARVFLTTGGGESIDTAAKLARQYWTLQEMPDRTHLISRTAAYHGTNAFGTSLGGIEANRAGFGPLITDTSAVEHNSVDALADEIERLGPERVAGFFIEPVIGAGGVYPPVPGYMEGVAKVCADTGVLLIIDSVICAFGRLGTWFGAERWMLRPDMIVFAKGVTSGYLPLGGVVVSARVAEPFWSESGNWFRHGPTYSGHASCCTAALANLDILEREGLIPRGRELEQPLLDSLAPLADHPLVKDVRGGIGLMAAVEFEQPAMVPEVFGALRDRDVLARPQPRGLAFSPPLIVTVEQLGLIGDAMREALDAVLEARGRVTAAAR